MRSGEDAKALLLAGAQRSVPRKDTSSHKTERRTRTPCANTWMGKAGRDVSRSGW